jgi:hypothetical protein
MREREAALANSPKGISSSNFWMNRLMLSPDFRYFPPIFFKNASIFWKELWRVNLIDETA